MKSTGILLAALLCGCAPPALTPPPPEPPPAASSGAPQIDAPPEDRAPEGRLPADVRPQRYAVRLQVEPDKERFSGAVDVEVTLEHARRVVWMHGKSLTVRAATIRPEGGEAVAAAWEQANDDGVAALRPARPLPAGRATVHIEFDAPLGTKQKGLYRVDVEGQSYAFTQLEAISAREVFPCFDEPAFKTPFDLSITARDGHQAVANTREVERKPAAGGMFTARFATTEPLPTYLIALAVGPLDVVEMPPIPPTEARKQPLPLRGVATRGRGKRMTYALTHTGPILQLLERYFGVPYPYDKLDIVAVPDKEGAMENPGLVTFREFLVMLDEAHAPVHQKRAYAIVMAHELAHQWFGDLVTMPWWDDIWLNEAFATWMAGRVASEWRADTQADIRLLESVQEAMGTDSLVSARAIRQPITSTHDIHNAFDSITYQKGGGVLSMFERWLGKETFQKGIQKYIGRHRMSTATSDDLMRALSEVSGKDVAAPFHTFLDQPGVPLVEARVACDGKPRVELRQSRYLPVGSSGSAKQTWKIPVCVRFGEGKRQGEACALLDGEQGSIPLGDACPDWVFPNADGAGYYRVSLAAPDLAKLSRKGFSSLSTRERIAYGTALRTGFARATIPAADLYPALAPFASDPQPVVAGEPMNLLGTAHDWLFGDAKLRPRVERHARSLYARQLKELGFAPPAGKEESTERAGLRQRVLGFLAFTARDPEARRELKKRGLAYLGHGGDGALHPEVIAPELVGTALAVAMEDGDAALFDALLARLATTEDDLVRGRLLGALGSARNPALAARARDLALDPRLRSSEVLSPLWAQSGDPETRDALWAWIKDHFDALVARLPPGRAAGLPYLTTSACDEARAREVEAFFSGRVDKLEGGPRNLASASESIRLCSARKDAQIASIKAFFSKQR